MLHGRADETAALQTVLDDARAARGSALVVRGEAGIGKSTLVDEALGGAEGFTTLRCVGVESEHTWAFAGLQALLRPVHGLIETLPGSQQCMLSTVLGLTSADPAKRPPADLSFGVGMAVLNLLSEASAEHPVLCVVDDAHWLDRESADVLLFAARRLGAERVAMVVTARDGYAPHFPAPGLPELRLGPLSDEAARRILGDRFAGISTSTRQRILRAAGGNPLALLELPPVDFDTRPATAFGGSRHSTTERLKQTFADRIDRLPTTTRDLLLLAAAEDTGDTGVILAAAAKLGAGLEDLAPAEADDLIAYRQDRFEFGHPLIRSVAYRGAPSYRRIEAHQALAAAIDPDDRRRVLHLAAATTGPDEDIAASLEAAAECAAGCGGHTVEYSVLERAAGFSPDDADRARRLTRAAEAALTAGDGRKAGELAAAVALHARDRAVLGRATVVAATVATWSGRTREAYRLWMEAADHYAAARPEATGAPLFRAVEHAWKSGDVAGAEAAAERAERLGLEHAPWVRDLAAAAAGLNRSCSYTAADAVAALRRLLDIHNRHSATQSLIERTMTVWWHVLTGDMDAARAEIAEVVRECREAGASGALPRALVINGVTEFHKGRWNDAEAFAANAVEIGGELGQRVWLQFARAQVLGPIAALRGQTSRVRELTEATEDGPEGPVGTAGPLLEFSLGRYDSALDGYAAILESEVPGDAITHVPTAVEAAVRAGRPQRLAAFLDWYADWAAATGKPHWEALLERCRGLLAEDETEAGAHLARAADLHRRDDKFPFETARTDLLLGEWLRRARRVNEAKTRLRSAVEVFERLGAAPWVERVRAELRAAGDAGPIESEPGLAERLTPQELQVVRLAANGLTNREIGEQLYMSPRTAGYHLYKAYPKLGVASRTELSKLGL
ncbi:helix-turn-helix transcriptional regulator [Glycomyces salinus]|uniref:helix-turn-helix transcriptional regulator n=1 Tax=Glycomyces salinus TaxID=980294 RepID=UPI0018ED9AC8|nr:AAA family ATPase [Glycomyces salinus]